MQVYNVVILAGMYIKSLFIERRYSCIQREIERNGEREREDRERARERERERERERFELVIF